MRMGFIDNDCKNSYSFVCLGIFRPSSLLTCAGRTSPKTCRQCTSPGWWAGAQAAGWRFARGLWCLVGEFPPPTAKSWGLETWAVDTVIIVIIILTLCAFYFVSQSLTEISDVSFVLFFVPAPWRKMSGLLLVRTDLERGNVVGARLGDSSRSVGSEEYSDGPTSTTRVGMAPLPCSMDTTLSWEQFLKSENKETKWEDIFIIYIYIEWNLLCAFLQIDRIM